MNGDLNELDQKNIFFRTLDMHKINQDDDMSTDENGQPILRITSDMTYE